jgi:ABC-type bacteriocin/lantibiotic exporter with double-glycine peptidase domain
MFSPLLTAVLITVLAPQGEQTRRDMFDWPQIEQQIQWHRERVRACGPLSAIHVLQLLGHDVDAAAILGSIKSHDNPGTPLADVLRICREHERNARIVRLPRKNWRRLECPCILIIHEGHHAVALRSLSRGHHTATVWDPGDSTVKTLPLDELEQLWTGDAILLHGWPWRSIALGIANVLMLSAFLVRQLRQRRENRR